MTPNPGAVTLKWAACALVAFGVGCGGAGSSPIVGGDTPAGSNGSAGSSGGGSSGGSSGSTGSGGNTSAATSGASTGGPSTSHASSSSSSSSRPAGDAGTGTSGVGPNCGQDDPNLAGVEPSMPSTICQTITSTGTNIQTALNACAGKGAVKLTGATSFSVASLALTGGEVLQIDSGVTLNLTGTSSPGLINVTGANAGIYGPGTIDAANAGSGTTMIHSSGSKFVLYKLHIHNSQKMHVKVQGDGFVVWGNTIISGPNTSNTDGIDPGAGGSGTTSNGFIVCNMISVGDDQIAIKGAEGLLSNLTIAHNYFGAGHGMSIGSETGPGGIDGVKVYDLTVDGNVFASAGAVNANAIRIKSYNGAGGTVDHISYSNICARNLHSALLITPNYTQGSSTGGGAPNYGNISVTDFHQLRGSGNQSPSVSITGTTGSLKTSVTLDNFVVDGLTTRISASSATVTVGPGGASPGVSASTDGTPHPIDCSSRFMTFPTN
jgi:polygalacturonase